MKLPNAAEAFVDVAKLRDYCLSTSHPRGRHKARVFRAALGLSAADAEVLRLTLLEAARAGDAFPDEDSPYGSLYRLDFEMTTDSGGAAVRSTWMVRRGETFPRLVSCFVL